MLEHTRISYNCAFLDDGEVTIVDGVPVIGKTSGMVSFYSDYKLLLETIGKNKLREKLYILAVAIGYTFQNIIHPSAYICINAHIGYGCVIFNNAVVQKHARCGDGCISNPDVELHHDSTISSYCFTYANSAVRSILYVGDRVWIGSTVIVSTSATVPGDTTMGDGEAFKAG